MRLFSAGSTKVPRKRDAVAGAYACPSSNGATPSVAPFTVSYTAPLACVLPRRRETERNPDVGTERKGGGREIEGDRKRKREILKEGERCRGRSEEEERGGEVEKLRE